MAAINKRRFWLGVLAGGVVWTIFGFLLGRVGAVEARYAAATAAGQFLKVPRYSLFAVEWIVLLFLLTYILAWLYVSLRGALGPSPWTALRVGFLAGFAMAFPLNFALAAWAPYSRVLPLFWTIELWVGAILASLVAGWVYKD
jgi:hypothetical protein